MAARDRGAEAAVIEAAVNDERGAATRVPPDPHGGARGDDRTTPAPDARPSHRQHTATPSRHDRSRWTVGPDPARAP
jgi:hypothetical protein